MKRLFPMFVDLTDRKIIVIGGGKVAARKIRLLLDEGPKIKVYASHVIADIADLAESGRIVWICEYFTRSCLETLNEAFLVVCATDDPAMNRMVSDYCRQRQIWVNSATDRTLSTFTFPSMIRRGPVVIGIGTSGQVPALSKHLRKRVEDAVPEWYEELAKRLFDEREALKETNLTEEERKAVLYRLIEDFEESFEKDKA